MDQFPGVVFRSGPTGRRAGLVGGPDVWEVVRDIKGAAAAGAADAVARVSEVSGLSRSKVELALSYDAAHPDAVDEPTRRRGRRARATGSRGRSRSVKLVLDEMWNPTIARELRRRGHDVIAIQEPQHSRYAGIPDDPVFALAQKEARTIVTDNIVDYERVRLDWETTGSEHKA